jgi:hypothetical protein
MDEVLLRGSFPPFCSLTMVISLMVASHWGSFWQETE